MAPYWLVLAIAIIGGFFEAPRHRVEDRKFLVPMFLVFSIVIWLFVSFRYEVGADWYTYLIYYSEVAVLDFSGAIDFGDPAYALINWLASRFYLDIWVVNAVCAALFCIGLTKLCLRQSRPWLALAVAIPYFVTAVAMGYTRQGSAIGLVLLGLDALIYGRSNLRFVAWVLLAATFHKTALFVIPVAQMMYLRRNWWGVPLFVVAVALGYWFFLRDSISGLIDLYIIQEFASSGALARVILTAFPAAIFLLALPRLGLSPGEKTVWSGFAWTALAMIVLLLLSPSSTAVDRLGLYLIPIQIVTLSRLPDLFGTRDSAGPRIVLSAVVMYCAGVQAVWLSIGDYAYAWLPYRSYLEGLLG